jgi:aspartate/methionine/tyrosine aminotransferase
MEDFYRIRRLPPYVFEQVNRAKAAARNAGADIIDLGMGNPDLPTPAHVIEKLKDTLGKPRTDRYSASRGITGLRKAQAGYYPRPRSSRRWAPRRALPTWRRRSPRPATWCCARIRAIRFTPLDS